MSEQVRVVIHTPELWPDIRESHEMPRDEAVAWVNEINEEGTFLGSPARAYIGRKPTPIAAANPKPRAPRKPQNIDPGRRIPSCIMPPRNVRASSREWRGERGTGTSKLGYSYERLTERWADR